MVNIGYLLGSHSGYGALTQSKDLIPVHFGRSSYSGPLEFIGMLNLKRIRKLLNINLRNGHVYIHDGIVAHVAYHHGDIYRTHESKINKMIEYPDFVGINPREPDSLELYVEEGHLLLAINRNQKAGYLFLASMYVLDDWNRKIHDRLRSKRIKRYA